MVDLVDELREKKFIMLDRSLTTAGEGLFSWKKKTFPCGVLISNVSHWMAHEEEIEDWCHRFLSHYERHGMVIFLGSHNDLLMFKLRFM